ncbi:recombinase family protein [Rhizobium sp. 2YAF20]|uniref:recombinase family protein n=1 Tax=Rhizobium sp. 2YAF20 TaxID=3233027 RepID=UPI003F99CD64
MTKKVLIYARAKTRRGGGSIEVQIKRGKEFVAENDWSLVKTYSDTEVTGVVFKSRPGIQSLFAHLEREKIDAVLCDTLPILSRRFRVLVKVLGELRLNGVELWVADPGAQIVTRNLLDQLPDCNDADHSGNPAVESLQTDAVTTTGIVSPAFGYKLSHAHNAQGQRISGFRVVDPLQSETVRRIFAMYAEGFSPRQIAERLNAEGVAAPGGKAWRDTTIRGDRSRGNDILNNALYVGQLNSPGGSPLAYLPPLRILRDELWDRVRRRDAAMSARCGRTGASRMKLS